jgi:hypothetical protein
MTKHDARPAGGTPAVGSCSIGGRFCRGLMGTAMVYSITHSSLPLWLSFYWQRGVMRFTSALVVSVALMMLTLVFVSQDTASLVAKLQSMFGFWFPIMAPERLHGIWQFGWDPIYRLPIIISCGIIAASLISAAAEESGDAANVRRR